MEYLYCLDSVPNLFGLFDTTIAPPLLYYSYIPIVIVALLFGLLVYHKAKIHSLQNTLFFAVLIVFSLFILNEIVQWIAVPTALVYFGWQLAPLLQTLILLLSVYFVAVFLNRGDLSFGKKITLFSFALPVLILLPTVYNMGAFDLVNCEAEVGPLFTYVYIIEIFAIFFILYIYLRRYFTTEDKLIKRQILLLLAGIVLFLTLLSTSNIFGEVTQLYEINLLGPIGMVVFLGILAYMIVKFNTFSIKLLATQALVWGLVILIGSQFFFITSLTNMILNSITFAAILIFGYLLIKSVEREVKQREELAKLNTNLNKLVIQRESLMHLINHKVKGAFTRSKYIFAGMLDGTFGEANDEIKKRAQQGLESDNTGIETIDLVLNAANMEKGQVKYDLKNIDLKEIVSKTFAEKKERAEAKGLALISELKDGTYMIMGDAFWLKEVMNNLIENSIRYTKEGKIAVAMERKDSKVLVTVKDTGIGITDEDKKNLFTEGGRGKDSVKMNVDSTGYGLYSVKLILDAHKGKVWVQSEGPGKGSTFFVELPASN